MKIVKPMKMEKHKCSYWNLVEAVERKNDVSLVYWVKGHIETEIGKIKKVDQINATVILVDKYGSTHTLSMISLVDVF
ncbi:YolD-like family protein [Gottfriedia sp. NPDC057948]|uniref:YolD-like family protein n=1 Tax=Gottfriedia sp. NPDC057948 TaxID=3346287 RepID=UPI0036DAA760